MRVRGFLILLLGALLGACAGAEDKPVSLPIPFAGSYTGDTSVVVSNGTPVVNPGNLLRTLSIKAQTSNNNTLVWKNFDASTGAEKGSTTFFLDTMTPPILSSFTSGIRRNYSLKACFDLGNGTQVCPNLECFEYPSTFPPSFNIDEVSIPPTCEQAKAVFRKAACSGNIKEGLGDFILGQLVDARLGLGMVECANGDFLFFSQKKSAVYIHGTPNFAASGSSSGEVLSTIISQGFASHLSDNPPILSTPTFLPGSAAPVGTEDDTVLGRLNITPDHFDGVIDIKACISENDCLIVHQVHLSHDSIPELVDVISEQVRTDFRNDPAFSDLIFADNQQAVFYPTSDDSDQDVIPINCEEQTGVFKDLCDNFGPLRFDYRCLILANPVTSQVVTVEGSLIISRRL